MEGFVIFVLVNWLGWALVVGHLGKDREIGRSKAVGWSLLFSPLIGLIVTLASPRADPRAASSPEARKLLAQGEREIKKRKYDEAIDTFERLLGIQPFAPTTNYYLASLYSAKGNKISGFRYLARAIEQGFKDFGAIHSSDRFQFLRNQPEFREFAQNGYKLPEHAAGADSDRIITALDTLGKLRADGVLTPEEFEAQKRRLLKQ
jgi:tetratricopeptide (TPR) repeat protein